MAYCRFSTDDFRCDFYAYEDAGGGYTLHVAGSRLRWEPPAASPYDPRCWQLPAEEFNRISREYHAALAAADREPIGLDGAGDTQRFETLREMCDRIRELLELGFRAPDWLVPRMEEEMEEE